MTYRKAASLSVATVLPAFCIILMTLFLLPIKAHAEAHGYFYIPDGAVPSGEEFTVSVQFTADSNIGTVQAAVTYDESCMQFISGDGTSGGGGILTIRDFPSEESSEMTLDLKFKALKESSSQLNLTNASILSPDGESLSHSVTAYATVTIGAGTQNTDSSDNGSSSQPSGELTAVLSSLTIENGELRPAFSPGIYNYTVTVPHDLITFEMEGVTADETDTIWYEGALYLVDGMNQRTITVTSADGKTSNVYTVNIYREYGEDSESEESYTSETDEYDSEYEEISEAENDSTEIDSITDSVAPAFSDDGRSGMDDLRDRLMPALYVAMAVILLAVIILIVWIRTKIKNKLK